MPIKLFPFGLELSWLLSVCSSLSLPVGYRRGGVCVLQHTTNNQNKTHIDLLGQLCPDYDRQGYCGGGNSGMEGENTCDFWLDGDNDDYLSPHLTALTIINTPLKPILDRRVFPSPLNPTRPTFDKFPGSSIAGSLILKRKLFPKTTDIRFPHPCQFNTSNNNNSTKVSAIVRTLEAVLFRIVHYKRFIYLLTIVNLVFKCIIHYGIILCS